MTYFQGRTVSFREGRWHSPNLSEYAQPNYFVTTFWVQLRFCGPIRWPAKISRRRIKCHLQDVYDCICILYIQYIYIYRYMQNLKKKTTYTYSIKQHILKKRISNRNSAVQKLVERCRSNNPWPPLAVIPIAQGLLAHQLQQWPKTEFRDYQIESNFLMHWFMKQNMKWNRPSTNIIGKKYTVTQGDRERDLELEKSPISPSKFSPVPNEAFENYFINHSDLTSVGWQKSE